MNLLKDFKDFAFKGNLIDMAVGIIIGGAFSTVVKSLVDNIFMPPLGKLTGGVNFSDKFFALDFKDYESYAIAKQKGAPVLGYGQFLTDFISFLLLAVAMFLLVKKALDIIKRDKAAPEQEKVIEPSNEEKLLTEIRDLLKQKA